MLVTCFEAERRFEQNLNKIKKVNINLKKIYEEKCENNRTHTKEKSEALVSCFEGERRLELCLKKLDPKAS